MIKKLLILPTILFFALVSKIDAQEALTLTASPTRVGDDGSLLALPGETLQTTLKIRNNSDQSIKINSTVLDFIIAEDGSTPTPIDEETNYRWSLKQWVTLAPREQILGPQQIAYVQAIISVPPDALPGGHYAMIAHQPATNTETIGSGAGVNQRVGSLLYVIVDGPISEEAFIHDLRFPKFSEFGPVDFSFKIDNQSDIHIVPQISIDFYNLLGRKVDSITLPSKNIFPLMTRDFTGRFTKIWGSGFYRAKINVLYGRETQLTSSSFIFYLLPIKLIAALIVVILVLLAMGISVRRHLKHRNDNQQAKIDALEAEMARIKEDQLKKYDN